MCIFVTMRSALILLSFISCVVAQPTDTLVARLSGMPDGSGKVFMATRIASRIRNNHPDSAMRYLEAGIAIASRVRVASDTLAFAHNELGLVYEDKGRADDAEKAFLTAIDLFGAAHNESGQSKAYNNLGGVYRTKGNLEAALGYYLKSLEIKQRLNDDTRASPLNNIGLVFMMQEQYQKSIDYYLLAVEIYERKADSIKLVVAYNNIGESYYKLGDFNNSIGYFLRAIKISKKKNDLTGLSSSYESIAKIYMKREEYTKALEYCMLGIGLCQQLGRITKLIEINNTRAELLINLRRYEEAVPILTLNLQQEEELQAQEFKLRTLQLLVRAHKALLHRKEARQYEKMSLELQKELKDAGREQRMNQLEEDFHNKPKGGE